MKLRRASIFDLKAIMNVEKSAFDSETQESPDTMLLRLMTFPDCFLVLEDEKTHTVTGYLCAEFLEKFSLDVNTYALNHTPIPFDEENHEDRFVYISSVAILPEYRGRGLGRHLIINALQHFVDDFEDTKAAAILVNKKWKKAQRIYDECGFFPVKEFKKFFPDGGDGLLQMVTLKVTYNDAYLTSVLKSAFRLNKPSDVNLIETSLDQSVQNLPEWFAAYKDSDEEYQKMFYDFTVDTLLEEAVCTDFDSKIIQAALKKGFYPMSMPFFGANLLTVKYHKIKLIITFDNFHIPKNVPRYIRNNFADYTITFNRDFMAVVDAINTAYEDTWLCPELVQKFYELNQNPKGSVSCDSVEIWHDGKLVAGEIGFITGNAYASLSGFHTEKDIGTVQMAVLGLILKEKGFAYWDLGMSLPYKYRFGAVDCDRKKQATLYEKRDPRRKRKKLPNRETKLSEFLPRL